MWSRVEVNLILKARKLQLDASRELAQKDDVTTTNQLSGEMFVFLHCFNLPQDF